MFNDIMAKMQQIREQQTQKMTTYFRSQTQSQNRAKINFPPKKPNPGPENEKYEKFMENQPIDPWNTSLYNREEDVKGMRKLLQSKRKQKRNTNMHFINRAAMTTRSWNAERERLLHLRKQMHMASPVFEANQTENQGDVLCYLRRKNEKEGEDGNKETSESNKSFSKHRKLLSRIYSHSCEPKMLIKRLTQNTENATVVRHEANFIIPSIKFKSHSMDSKKQQKTCYNFNNNGFTRLMEQKQKPDEKAKLFKIKSTGLSSLKKQQLQIL